MRGQMIKEYMSNKMFAVCPSYLDNLVATINSYDIAKIETIDDNSELESLNSNTLAVMPSTEKLTATHTLSENTNIKRTEMADTENVTIESLQAQLAAKEATIEAMQVEVDGASKKLSEVADENTTLKKEVADSNYRLEVAKYAVAMGMERGASKDVILNAMVAKDKLEAGDLIAESIATSGVTVLGENKINKEEDEEDKEHEDSLLAYAENNKIKG